jgi:hypothetical protein
MTKPTMETKPMNVSPFFGWLVLAFGSVPVLLIAFAIAAGVL